MKHFLDIIFKPIREQKVLFWFLILMSCVVIPVMCYATGAFPKPFVFAPPIFDCYLLTVLAYFLRRIHLSWLVWIACILLLGGEVFSILCYQSPYSMTVLVIFGTFSKMTQSGLNFLTTSTAGIISLFRGSNFGRIPFLRLFKIVPIPFEDIP